MNRKLIITLIVVIAIIFSGFGIYKFLANQKQLPKTMSIPEVARYVTTSVVHYDTIQVSVSAKGRVSPLNTVDLIAEGVGKMQDKKGHLDIGQKFNKGDELFYIYKDEAELSLKATKSNFQNSIANILPDIRLDYNEYYQAFLDFFNEIDVDHALPDFPEVNSEKFKLYLSSNDVLAQYFNVQKDEMAVGRYTSYAPFNGSFSQIYIDPGTFANIGTPVVQIIQTDTVEIVVPVDVSNAKFVLTNDNVKINGKVLGRVVSKSEYVDENTQSQIVYVHYKNSEEYKIFPGEFALVEFIGQEIEHVMEIPRNAVFNFNELYTIKNGRLVNNVIEVIKLNDRSLYFKGLSEGDTIVTQPLIGVTNGAKVKPIKH